MDVTDTYVCYAAGVRELIKYSGSLANEVICFPYLGFVFSRIQVAEGMVMSVGSRWAEIDQDRQR